MSNQEAKKIEKTADVKSPIGSDDSILLEKIFNIYKQPGSNHMHYNILTKVEFGDSVGAGNYTTYYTTPDDTWTLISYKHYKRINLWIMHLINII